MNQNAIKAFAWAAALALLTGCNAAETIVNGSSILHCTTHAQAEEYLPQAAHGAHHAELPASRFIVKMSPTAISQHQMPRLQEDLPNSPDNAPAIAPINTGLYGLEFSHELSSSDVTVLLHGEDIDYIEPDYAVYETSMPNDPDISEQWAHRVVDSSDAWNISRGGSDVLVGVLDSGVDYTHPDLAGNIWQSHGWNFIANNDQIMADDTGAFHGTHVAGTIGAVGNNGIGISGHAQSVKLLPLKFINSDGLGYTSDAIKGIDYAIANKARIINNSWGSGFDSQALSEAIYRARQAGILFVAAAGNDGTDNDSVPFYPASYPYDNVIRVAASDISDHLARWSNYGTHSVDLAAPGVNILSTKNGAAYQYLSGTSMATPLVSGVLATMIALRPDLTYLEIKDALLKGVDEIPEMAGKIKSGGRINSFRALLAAKEAEPADSGINCGIIPQVE